MLVNEDYLRSRIAHMLMLMCLFIQGCGGEKKSAVIETEPEVKATLAASVVKAPPLVITFLGFHGARNCFQGWEQSLHAQLEQRGLTPVEASPQSPDEFTVCGSCCTSDELTTCGSCCAKLDGWYWTSTDTHLGLGDITQQARAAEKRLRENGILRPGQTCTLVGQSQGCLVLVEFWRLFRDKYNIVGTATMVPPFLGVELINSLSSPQKLQTAAQLVEVEHKTSNHHERRSEPEQQNSCSACCYSCCCNTSCLTCYLPCMGCLFQYCGHCCCRGVTQMTPGSTFVESLTSTFEMMAKAQLPFLNITASCPAPEEFSHLPFGKEGTKYLIGGGRDSESDNLIATRSQELPVTWDQAKEVQLAADHGVSNPKDPNDNRRYIQRVFAHPKVISQIVSFCSEHLAAEQKKSK